MLNDSFYTVQEFHQQPESVQAVLQLNVAHTIFDGHFPGNPVTPGVVQMEIVKELLARTVGQPVAMKSMGTCKFLAILNPNETPVVTVDLKLTRDEENNLKVTAGIVAGEQSFFKMNGVYREQ